MHSWGKRVPISLGGEVGKLSHIQAAFHLGLQPLPSYSGQVRSTSAGKGILSLPTQWNQGKRHKNHQAAKVEKPLMYTSYHKTMQRLLSEMTTTTFQGRM